MDKLYEILTEYTEVPQERFSDNTKIVEDLGLDSFAIVSMIADVETAYDIDLQDCDLAMFSTLGDLKKYLKDNNKI